VNKSSSMNIDRKDGYRIILKVSEPNRAF